jgi:DNA-binding MarR family transcriptional regulator
MPQERDRDELGMLISTVARMKRTRFDNCARELGLTRPQWRALNIIRFKPGINQSQLARRLEVGHITVTRQLDALETMGWVERRPDPDDRRSWQLYLTPAADPIIARIDRLVAMLHEEEYLGVSARELAQAERVLRKIHGNLKVWLRKSPPDLASELGEADDVEAPTPSRRKLNKTG